MTKYLPLVAALAISAPLYAENLVYQVISFDVRAERTVAQDEAVATLFVETNSRDAARASKDVNAALAQVSKALQGKEALKVEGTRYQTYPVYTGKATQPSGWRARGEMQVSSKDFGRLAEFVAAPGSDSVHFGGVQYRLSDEAQRQLEQALANEALQKFKVRAGELAGVMGSKNWKVVDVAVNQQGYAPPRPYMMMKGAMEADVAAAPPAPVLEGGEATVSVTATGRIQYQ
ncbi:SIMPL domain-containing protein [Chitinibacteraceae bacterium HSL-7]